MRARKLGTVGPSETGRSGPDARTTSGGGGGGSPAAGPRAPLRLNSRLAAAPSSLPGPGLGPPGRSSRPPHRAAPEAARSPRRPHLGLSAPLPSTARSTRPRSRRAAPTARARRPALTREGRWRRRSSTCAERRAEAGIPAPQQQPRQPPSCQHRSGRHRPPAPPGGGRGRGLLLKGPQRGPGRAGRVGGGRFLRFPTLSFPS